jgi:hypothetical protein
MPTAESDFINPQDFFLLNLGDVNSILDGNNWTVVWLGVES